MRGVHVIISRAQVVCFDPVKLLSRPLLRGHGVKLRGPVVGVVDGIRFRQLIFRGMRDVVKVERRGYATFSEVMVVCRANV